jgi:zinc/manganese transport system substrate-binding protein
MPSYAQTLTKLLIAKDPQHRLYYQQRLAQFNQHYQLLAAYIQKLRQAYQNTPVIATEPVFGYMAQALDLRMLGQAFQISIMNNVEPSAAQTRAFEDILYHHDAKILFYNNQVSDPTTSRMQLIAQKMHIPVVGVSETEPAGKDYISWMLEQLQALNKALT